MNRLLSLITLGATLCASGLLALTPPIAVAPGDGTANATVGSRCPTFHWASAVNAAAYELVLYAVSADTPESPLAELYRVRLPGAARGWTPGVERCLAAGGSYAWSVGALALDSGPAWSEASLFQVATAPSIEEVEKALTVLQQYLDEGTGEDPEPALELESASDSVAAAVSERRRSAAERLQSRLSAGQLAGAGASLQAIHAPAPMAAAPDPSTEGRSLSVESNIELGSAANLFKGGQVLLWTDGASPGTGNTALGEGALASNADGFANTAIGLNALTANTGGITNVAVGYHALEANTTGGSNTAIGAAALPAATTGAYNTVMGYGSGYNISTGMYNTGVGTWTLFNSTTGSHNIAIGYIGGNNPSAGNFNIHIGNAGESSDTNTLRIGEPFYPNNAGPADDIGQNRAFITGIYDATISGTTQPVYVNDTHQLGSAVTSSRRFKEAIQGMGSISNRLLDLRPVTFRYRRQDEDGTDTGTQPLEFGLIAEEVAEAFPELAILDDQGRPRSVRYNRLAPLLLNEFQKEHRRVEILRSSLLLAQLGLIGMALMAAVVLRRQVA